jgi:hypothetical protein
VDDYTGGPQNILGYVQEREESYVFFGSWIQIRILPSTSKIMKKSFENIKRNLDFDSSEITCCL